MCFTNDHFLIHNYQIIINSLLSDHNTICISLNYEEINKPKVKKTNQYQSSIPEYDLKGGDDEDWFRLNLLFNQMDWEEILGDLSPEDSLSNFLKMVEEKVSLVFHKNPEFQQPDENSENQPGGTFGSKNKIPRKVRNLMRNKSKVSKALLRTKSVSRCIKLREKLDEVELLLKSSYQKRRLEKEKQAIRKMKRDPKAFFSYAKRYAKTKSDIGPFFNQDGNPELDPHAIAEMLRKQYDSVFSSPKEENMILNPDEFFSVNNSPTQLDYITFNRNDIIEQIDKLSVGAAAGPDGVPAILLKRCKHSLVDGLEIMFRKFLEDGKLPDMLKEAFVIPVHKGGSRGIPANFRPVSLTSHLMKTFERVIRQVLVCHLETNEKLNPNQHGFRARRSCLSQLLKHQDQILSILEEGHNVDSIYLDFAKAFDKVDIGILCHKLRNMGISGRLGILLHNFLTKRKQVILANGVKSKSSEVKSGVPQGTVLGPVLFLILINDIDADINSIVSLFADDTRIAKQIADEEDVESLQSDLNRLYSWQVQNNMQFNGGKFEILRYGKNTTLKESTSYFTPNYEEIIEEKECLRDLGIIMSNDCSFSSHVEAVCSQVRKKSGWILRTFQSRETTLMKFLWKTLVQGHIDYCSQLYFPTKSSDMEKVENLQRTFTSKIPEVRSLNYWERLAHLKIYSQQRRMERYRVIYAWKILEGLAPNCGLQETISIRRGREIKIPLVKGSGRIKTLREGSFQIHGGKLFNSLPKKLRDLTKISIEDFKSNLDQYLSSLPDEPKVSGYTPSACSQVDASPSNSIIDQAKADKLRRPG